MQPASLADMVSTDKSRVANRTSDLSVLFTAVDLILKFDIISTFMGSISKIAFLCLDQSWDCQDMVSYWACHDSDMRILVRYYSTVQADCHLTPRHLLVL